MCVRVRVRVCVRVRVRVCIIHPSFNLLLCIIAAICFPPEGCLNGGVCVEPGHCSCPSDYTGSRCDESKLHVVNPLLTIRNS